MNYRQNDIDNLFKDGFRDFNPEPPDHVWESVFNQLEENLPVKRQASWLRIAAAIAALIVPSIFMLWFYPHTSYNLADKSFDYSTIKNIFENIRPQTNTNINIGSVIPDKTYEVAEETQITEHEIKGQTTTDFAEQTDAIDRISTEKYLYLNNTNKSLAQLATSEKPIYINELKNPGLMESTNSLSLITEEKNNNYTSSLSASVSPSYSSNYFPDKPANSTGIPFESLEDNIKTYGFGLKYSLKGKGRFSIEAGLNYFSIGQIVNNILAFGVKEEVFNKGLDSEPLPAQSAITSLGDVSFNNSSFYFADMISYRINTEKGSQYSEPQLLDQYDDKISQYLRYIDVPVIASYDLMNYRNADISVRLGVSSSFLIGNNVYVGESDFGPVIGETSGINRFAVAGIGGVSFGVPVTSKLKLHLEPTARMFFTPVAENAYSGKIYPVNFYLSTGLSYSL